MVSGFPENKALELKQNSITCGRGLINNSETQSTEGTQLLLYERGQSCLISTPFDSKDKRVACILTYFLQIIRIGLELYEHEHRISYRCLLANTAMMIRKTRTKIPRAEKAMKDIGLRTEIASVIEIGGVVATK